MGYSIGIGELVVETDVHALQDDVGLSFSVRNEHHADAPAFGEPTDGTNWRWPSYTAWSKFSQTVGLDYALFWEHDLVGGHPGVRLVTLSLCNAVEQARDNMRQEYPTTTPQMGASELAGHLARLEWLHYWCQWALKNCKTPVMVNS